MKLEEQKEIWRKEQLVIASQVEILPDPDPPFSSSPHDDDVSDVGGGNNNRFRSIQLEHDDDHNNNNNNNNNKCSYYGGVDVSFPTNENDPSVAVYVILEYPSNKVVYQDHLYFELQLPYIPSFLAFREIDPLHALIEKQLEERPDLTPITAILVDGNGILHPRKAGIACFVGVKTNIPTIGIGKTLFYEGQLNKDIVLKQLEESLLDAKKDFCVVDGENNGSGNSTSENNNLLIIDSQTIPKKEEGNNNPGDTMSNETEEEENSSGPTPLTDRGTLVQELSNIGCRGIAVPLVNEEQEILACALVGHGGRTRVGGKKQQPYSVGTKNPIYVSIGHKISLQEAVRISALLSLAKIPEPVRQADLIGRELLRQKEQQQKQQK